MDKHMNLFENYTQIESLPLENNITRILARILNDNIYIFDKFIEKIQEKIDINIGSIENKYDIDIQERIGDIDIGDVGYNNIIGVALTAKELETNLEETEINNRRITDIIIKNLNDTLIIVEVKKTKDNCIEQLSEQINSIKAESEIKKHIISLEWTDIIDILENYKSISKVNDIIVDDYYDYLNEHFKEWFPVKKISLCSGDEKNLNKRIKCLLQNMQRIDKLDNKINIEGIKGNSEFELSVNWKWTSRIIFAIDKEGTELVIGFYPASSDKQYKELAKASNFKFLIEQEKNIKLIINDEIIDEKYIEKNIYARIRIGKFMQDYVTEIPLEVNKDKNYYDEIANKISGQWKLNKDTNLYEKVVHTENLNNKDLIYAISEITGKTREDLYEKLEEAIKKYNSIYVCLGFPLIFKIKIDALEKFDNEFNYKSNRDDLAEPIRDFILEIKKDIES